MQTFLRGLSLIGWTNYSSKIMMGFTSLQVYSLRLCHHLQVLVILPFCSLRGQVADEM